jgi:hypothetical protein
MSAFIRVIVAVFVLAALALGAIAARSPAAAQQPENKRTISARTVGPATIYFLRPEGMITPGSPDVELDGRKIGELRAGTYFVVQTKSGHHTLKIPGVFLAGSWEGDVTLAAGTTYFIELGTNQTGAIGMRALTGALAGTTGQQMSGRGFNASHSFYMLNSEEGRAIVAKLKRVGSK